MTIKLTQEELMDRYLESQDRDEMIELLADQVNDWDWDALIELAKEQQTMYYDSLDRKNLENEYYDGINNIISYIRVNHSTSNLAKKIDKMVLCGIGLGDHITKIDEKVQARHYLFIEDSLEIQKELWGHMSGLAMPNFSVDIPSGGGKAPIVPNFVEQKTELEFKFKGWDGVQESYINPDLKFLKKPKVDSLYVKEWEEIKNSKSTIFPPEMRHINNAVVE